MRIKRDHTYAQMGIAHCYFLQKDFVRALTNLEYLERRLPYDTNVIRLRICALIKCEQWATALSLCDRLLQVYHEVFFYYFFTFAMNFWYVCNS